MFGKKESPKINEAIQSTPVTQPILEKSSAAPELYAKIPVLIIREAQYSDKEQIYELGSQIPELQCSKEETFLTKDDLAGMIENYSNKTMIAEIQEKIIGFAIGQKEGQDYGCIYFVGIDPKYRNRGLGKALLKSVEDKLHVDTVYLLATNESAIQVFEKLGYKKGKTLTYMSRSLH